MSRNTVLAHAALSVKTKARPIFFVIVSLSALITSVRADVIDDILSFPQYLADSLYVLVVSIFYPVAQIFNMIISWIDLVYVTLLAIVNGLNTLILLVVDTVGAISSITLPNTWGALFLCLIFCALGMRLYRHVKGVSIFGWSI